MTEYDQWNASVKASDAAKKTLWVALRQQEAQTQADCETRHENLKFSKKRTLEIEEAVQGINARISAFRLNLSWIRGDLIPLGPKGPAELGGSMLFSTDEPFPLRMNLQATFSGHLVANLSRYCRFEYGYFDYLQRFNTEVNQQNSLKLLTDFVVHVVKDSHKRYSGGLNPHGSGDARRFLDEVNESHGRIDGSQELRRRALLVEIADLRERLADPTLEGSEGE